MSIEYAVNRLYDVGWLPANNMDLDTLPDGRRCPSLETVRREFHRAGLELSIKHNLMFNCHQAIWAPLGEPLDPKHTPDDQHGTVVGASDLEAAVYALAQLRGMLATCTESTSLM